MSDRRAVLLAEYAALPPAGSPDRGDAIKRFCRRWETRIWGLHRHYKGGLYIAHGLAIAESDLSVMVAYTAADGSQWLRPVENFLGEVTPGVRRFRRVRPKSPPATN